MVKMRWEDNLASQRTKKGTSDTTTVVTYSVQIYYTKEFAASTADIQTFTDSLIDTTNQGYINSKVPIRIKKHCTEQVSVADGMSSSATLNALQTLKPTLAEVRNSADVAVLYVKTFNTRSACGRARLFAIDSGSSQFGQTISVVAKSCAVTYYSFAHEIGHNVGLYHDRRTSVNPTYTFGQGHHITKGTASTGYRTILAYAISGHRTRVNYYSNPLVKFPATGTPSGVSGTADNARLLTQQRFKLAAMGDESKTCGGSIGSGCTMIKTPGKYTRWTKSIRRLSNSNLIDCEKKCDAEPLCESWYLLTRQKYCYLGSGKTGSPISNSYLSGGYKDCGDCKMVRTPGKYHIRRANVQSLRTSSLTVCEQKCKENQLCDCWHIRTTDNTCFIGKGRYGNPITNRVVSGGYKIGSCSTIKSCKTGATDWSCCTPTKQCDVGEGDCDTNKDCKAGLKCGGDNCKPYNPLASTGSDCCVKDDIIPDTSCRMIETPRQYYRWSRTVQSISNSNPTDCSKKCDLNPQCDAWYYYTSRRICYLGNGINGSLIRSSSYTGGFKSCCKMVATPRQYYGWSRTIQTTSNSNLADCEKKCDGNLLCEAWRYLSSRRYCYLGSGRRGSLITSSSFSGGYKNCCKMVKTANQYTRYTRQVGFYRSSSLTDCEKKCNDNSQCDSWYFRTSAKYCYLGSGRTGAPISSRTYSGGYKNCCKMIATPKKYPRWSRTIRTSSNSNLADCEKKCEMNMLCEAWYYYSSNRYCYQGSGPSGSSISSTTRSGGYKKCSTKRDCKGTSSDFNCCTPTMKCGQGKGDCDTDNDCETGLRCGINNCRLFYSAAHTSADCCARPDAIDVKERDISSIIEEEDGDRIEDINEEEDMDKADETNEEAEMDRADETNEEADKDRFEETNEEAEMDRVEDINEEAEVERVEDINEEENIDGTEETNEEAEIDRFEETNEEEDTERIVDINDDDGKNRSEDFDEEEAFLDDTIKEEDKARKEAVSEERLVDANQDGVNDV